MAGLCPRFKKCCMAGLEKNPSIEGKTVIVVRHAKFGAPGPSRAVLHVPVTYLLAPKE